MAYEIKGSDLTNSFMRNTQPYSSGCWMMVFPQSADTFDLDRLRRFARRVDEAAGSPVFGKVEPYHHIAKNLLVELLDRDAMRRVELATDGSGPDTIYAQFFVDGEYEAENT